MSNKNYDFTDSEAEDDAGNSTCEDSIDDSSDESSCSDANNTLTSESLDRENSGSGFIIKDLSDQVTETEPNPMRSKSVPQKAVRRQNVSKRPRQEDSSASSQHVGKKARYSGKKPRPNLVNRGKAPLVQNVSDRWPGKGKHLARRTPNPNTNISLCGDHWTIGCDNTAFEEGKIHYGMTRVTRSSTLENIESVRIATNQLSETIRKIRSVEQPQLQTMTVKLIVTKIVRGQLQFDSRNRHSQRDISFDYVKQLMTSLILLPQQSEVSEDEVRDLMIRTQDPIRFKIVDTREYISNGGHRIMSFLAILLGLVPMPTKIGGKRKYYLVSRDENGLPVYNGGDNKLKGIYGEIRDCLTKAANPLIDELAESIPKETRDIADPNFKHREVLECRDQVLHKIFNMKFEVKKFADEENLISQIMRLHHIAATPETTLNFLVDSPSIPDELSTRINQLIDERYELATGHVVRRVRRRIHYPIQAVADTRCMVYATLLGMCMIRTEKGLHPNPKPYVSYLSAPTSFAADNLNVGLLNQLCKALGELYDSPEAMVDDFRAHFDKLHESIIHLDETAVKGIRATGKLSKYDMHRTLLEYKSIEQKIRFLLFLVLNESCGGPQLTSHYGHEGTMRTVNNTYKKYRNYPALKTFMKSSSLSPYSKYIELIKCVELNK